MKDVRIIDHIQTAIMVVDKDFNIIEANNAFRQRDSNHDNNTILKKCFDAAYHFNESCGSKKAGACPARKSFLSKKVERTIHHYWIDDDAIVEEITTTPIFDNKGDVIYVVEEFRDISELLGLNKGIIGICSYCRKIRDEDGQWVTFEAYLHKHTSADFSHGICEECNEIVSNDLNLEHSCSHSTKIKCNG